MSRVEASQSLLGTPPVPPMNAARPRTIYQSEPFRLSARNSIPQAHMDALRALENGTPVRKPRVVPILGALPDNWQLGIAAGIVIGLVFQLIQTGVNSSIKAGQADILDKLASIPIGQRS